MINKKLFGDALHTLLFTWGSDAPAEAIWTFNELMEFYTAETGVVFSKLCEGPDEEKSYNIVTKELVNEGLWDKSNLGDDDENITN